MKERYDRDMSEEDAREEWDLLDSIEWDLETVAGYQWYEQTNICDPYELFVYDYPPDVKALRDYLLPRFCEAVRKELELEKLTA